MSTRMRQKPVWALLVTLGVAASVLSLGACGEGSSEEASGSQRGGAEQVSDQATASTGRSGTSEGAAPTGGQSSEGREVIPRPIAPPTGIAEASQPGAQPAAGPVQASQPAGGGSTEGAAAPENLLVRAYEHAGVIWHRQFQDDLVELGRLQWAGGLAPPPMRTRSDYLPYRRRVASAYQATQSLLANWRQIRERAMDYMLSEGYRFTRADVLTDAVCDLIGYEKDLLRWQMLERILFLQYQRIEYLAPYVSQWRIDPETLQADMTDQVPVEVQDKVFEIEEELLRLEEELELEQDFLRPDPRLLNPEEPIEVPEGLGVQVSPSEGTSPSGG